MTTKKASRPRAATKKPSRPVRRPAKRTPRAPDQEAMMAAWQKAMTPSEGHRRLEPLVGNWRARTTFSMGPAGPEQVSEGSSEQRWVLGGRYVEQRYRGTSMDMPFEGRGYTGYDNVRGKYVATWMDTFSTGPMHSVGTTRPTDAEIDTEAEAFQPSGKRIHFWCKLRIQDRDHHSYEMWTKAPNGRRYRTMLVEYTRA